MFNVVSSFIYKLFINIFLELLIVLIAMSSVLAEESKLNKIEKSLTQKYIDSLKEGKWGITDPYWVNLILAKEFFPNATNLSSLEGDPPSVSVFKNGDLIGYLFVTKDITSSKGYSS